MRSFLLEQSSWQHGSPGGSGTTIEGHQQTMQVFCQGVVRQKRGVQTGPLLSFTLARGHNMPIM